MNAKESDVADDAKGPPIALTEAAVEFVKRRREKMGMPNAALRLGVKGGGCNGLAYVTDFTEAPATDRDLVLVFSGLLVYVDRRSLKFIEGSVVDATHSLMHQGLKFANPREAGSCGCGATFSVKE